MSKPYDPGDESGSVPTLADAATTDTPVGGVVYLSGATPTIVSLANGLPVQPGTGTTWTISDGGGSVTVDGAVAVSGNVAVTGTFWQATQPVSIAATVAVSGPLTDAQLRASAVPVSLTSTTITGTVAAAQSGTWTVTGAGGTFPVTDSGGSLTVDAPVGTPVYVRLSDGSAAITQLPVRMLAIDDDADTFGLVAGTVYTAGVNDAVILWSNLRDASGNAIASATAAPGASDRGLVVRPIDSQPTTATLLSVAGSATSVQLLAANAARRGATIVNDSAAVLYVKLGETASASNYTYRLPAYATLELPDPVYTGRIDGIWASATGNARVTEVS